jgi:hypothetical protein
MHPVNILRICIQILTIRYFPSFGVLGIPCVLYLHSIQSYLRTQGFSIQGVPKTIEITYCQNLNASTL